MKKLPQILALVLFVAPSASLPKSSSFEWPDSSKYWRVIVNANQYIQNYVQTHPRWFSQDKLITDLTVIRVPPGGQDTAVQQYNEVRQFLESRRVYVGTYVSGRAVIAGDSTDRRYPRARVSIEDMPPALHYVESLKEAESPKLIDVTDAQARHALQAAIKQIWKSSPAPVRFVDNMPPHSNGPPWEATCRHMEELRELGESLGSRVIFNIPIHVDELSENETRELIQAVGQGGIALEMPWLPYVRENKEATRLAEKRYRELLDSGMAIVMIPIKTPEDLLTNWVRSWRKPSDHLYLAAPFWKAPDMAVYRPTGLSRRPESPEISITVLFRKYFGSIRNFLITREHNEAVFIKVVVLLPPDHFFRYIPNRSRLTGHAGSATLIGSFAQI